MDRHARHRRRPADPRRRPGPGWRAADLEDFWRLVDRAMAGVPPAFRDRLDNVEVAVEQVPDGDEVLLGRYDGVPLPERGHGDPVLPARVTLFRGPLEHRAMSAAHLAHEVSVTLMHELGHHFGIDDDRLDDLGWG